MTLRLPPYPAYKNSGVEWFEQMPTHWGMRRAKRLFAKEQRLVCPDDDVVTCFRDGTVTLRKNRRTTGFTESLKEIGYQGVRAGDLVIHAMDAFAGAIGVSDSNGKCTPVYAICAPIPEANAHYYSYVVREMSRNKFIIALAKGIRERSTDFRYELFATLPLPVPPRDEQDAIVRFLEHTDRRVNRLIKAKRRLIELLHEQKQAVIHRAVTVGLDPDAPRKPSGVDWLGDIPAHWEVRKVNQCFNLVGSGTTPQSGNPLFYENGTIPWIMTGDPNDGRLTSPRHHVTELALTQYSVLRLYPAGTVLIALYGATIGKTSLLDFTACVNQACCALSKPRNLSSDYALLMFVAFKKVLISLGVGGGQPNISQSLVRGFRIPIPPKLEQQDILKWVNETTIGIDLAIERTKREIELIREYRIRLIADVVTGKIDVRGVALPVSESAAEWESIEADDVADVEEADKAEEATNA